MSNGAQANGGKPITPDRRNKMKIKLNNKYWRGLTEVYFDGEHFRAYDDVAGYDVTVDHMMSEGQKKRVKAG